LLFLYLYATVSYFDYDSIAHSIDELIILNVERDVGDITPFCTELKRISDKYFMPIAAGGGIRSLEDVQNIILAGADKVVLNTALFENQGLIKQIVRIYGSQCVIASIDYKYCDGSRIVFTSSGRKRNSMELFQAFKLAEKCGCGEIYVTSIDHDGTGEGFDLRTLNEVSRITKLPIIASGGGGKYDHFVNVYRECNIGAAATADLFNFMGDGLQETRKFIEHAGIRMANFFGDRSGM
jgi:cyclase